MFRKEIKSATDRRMLFTFFLEYITEMECAKKLAGSDENKNSHIIDAANCLLNASYIEKKIEMFWKLDKDLLRGLFVYLYALDDHFNPRLNTIDEFFMKIFTRHTDLLKKIGNKTVKPTFPFVCFENHKKKILLIR